MSGKLLSWNWGVGVALEKHTSGLSVGVHHLFHIRLLLGKDGAKCGDETRRPSLSSALLFTGRRVSRLRAPFPDL